MLLIVGVVLAGIWFYKWLHANADYFEKKGIKYAKQDIIGLVKNMTARDKSIADLVELMYSEHDEKYEKIIIYQIETISRVATEL